MQLKAEVTTLKAKLADSELLISKYQRDIAEKRKIHMAESQSLNNKLKKMTVARDQLVKNLDEMTDRWKYLEQQVTTVTPTMHRGGSCQKLACLKENKRSCLGL